MSMLIPEHLDIGSISHIGPVEAPPQQTAPTVDLYTRTRAWFQGDKPVCMDGVGYELDPQSYVWSEEDDGIRARRGTGTDSFQAQYCPEGKIISPEAGTQIILTEPFTGCAFFMCTFEGRQLVCHFNNAMEKDTYINLADELMGQHDDAIDTMIENLPEYGLAGDQDVFKEEKWEELRTTMARKLHDAIIGDFDGNQSTPAHFPSDFLMKSTSASEPRVGYDGEHLVSCTTAVLVKNGTGWSMLTQSHKTSDKVDSTSHKNVYHSPKIDQQERGITPLVLDAIYPAALQSCGLQSTLPTPQEMLLIHDQ